MTLLIFFIVLAVLILVHEIGHFLIAKKSNIRVDEFGLGFPPKIFAWKPKGSETTYSLNWIPFGGFVKIHGESPDEESIKGKDRDRSLVNKPPGVQIAVLAAGVVFNIIFAWILISVGFMTGLPASTDIVDEKYFIEEPQLLVTAVSPDSPAQRAGLEPGDAILFAESGTLSAQDPTVEEIQKVIREGSGESVTFFIKRGGVDERMTFSVVPEEGIVPGEVAVGISMDRAGIARLPVHLAFYQGADATINMTAAVTVGLIGFIADAVSGGSALSQVTGPVGIAGLVGDAARMGLSYLILFTAIISIHLAIINLLPIPALDGGRILFVIIEKIKGSRISPKIQNAVNTVGFALLILLMIVVTFNDIVRLF